MSRVKGKLHRIVVGDGWYRTEIRDWTIAFRSLDEDAAKPENQTPVHHNDFVIFLGQKSEGFLEVLHEKGIVYVHKDFVTITPEKMKD